MKVRYFVIGFYSASNSSLMWKLLVMVDFIVALLGLLSNWLGENNTIRLFDCSFVHVVITMYVGQTMEKHTLLPSCLGAHFE